MEWNESFMQYLKSEMALQYFQNGNNTTEGLDKLSERLRIESWSTLKDIDFIMGCSQENVEKGVKVLIKVYDTFIKDYPNTQKDIMDSIIKNPLEVSKLKSNIFYFFEKK